MHGGQGIYFQTHAKIRQIKGKTILDYFQSHNFSPIFIFSPLYKLFSDIYFLLLSSLLVCLPDTFFHNIQKNFEFCEWHIRCKMGMWQKGKLSWRENIEARLSQFRPMVGGGDCHSSAPSTSFFRIFFSPLSPVFVLLSQIAQWQSLSIHSAMHARN